MMLTRKRLMKFHQWPIVAAAVLLSAFHTVAAQVQPTPMAQAKGASDSPAPEAKSASQYLRTVEDKGKSVALEIATRTFARPDGTGPKVALVGVAHIGDKSFYQCVQKLLQDYDVVLYESVKPPGAGGAHGETDSQRMESTKSALQFIGGMIETYHAKTHAYPADINELRTFASTQDGRLGKFIDASMNDAWGHEFVYQRKPDESKPEHGAYSLVSLGGDGKPGGEGVNADLNLADQPLPDPLVLSKEDGIQTQLASALGLKFQLDAISYDHDNWRCSDMAMDEVDRRLQAKGLDFSLIGGTLAGSSLPAKVIKVVLGMMKIADAFLEGALADTFKVVMIEMLGDEKLTQMSLDQLGQGFGDVIVGDRNQVAIDDLKQVIEREPKVKSVAVLYGAAHMPDMAKKLSDQLGYQPLPENAEKWLTAIKVDFSQSAVSPAEVNRIRLMMRQMLRQQLRGADR